MHVQAFRRPRGLEVKQLFSPLPVEREVFSLTFPFYRTGVSENVDYITHSGAPSRVAVESRMSAGADAEATPRFPSPGRPREFRPEPPTDPDVNLSIHPARATLKKAAAFHQDKEFLRLPVDSILT